MDKTAKPVGKCRPSGPYCIGLDAILDADVKRGAQVSQMINVKTLQFTREVITHASIYEGKKLRMQFTFCPCCGERLVPEKTQGGD